MSDWRARLGIEARAASQNSLPIEPMLLQDAPVISPFYGPTWYAYQSNVYADWPTPSNPYAAPDHSYPCTRPIVIMCIRLPRKTVYWRKWTMFIRGCRRETLDAAFCYEGG